MIFSSSKGVLKIISIKSLGVIKELNLIRLVILGIVPRVISLVVWGDVGMAISNLIVLVD
jgi:hypothetical protein